MQVEHPTRPVERLLHRSAAVDLARECVYRFLSAVVGGPYSNAWGQALDPSAQDLALAAADLLDDRADDAPTPDPASVESEITRLVEELRAPMDVCRSDYDRIFGLVTPKECPPYETEYYPTQETFARSQEMADVAGFYHAFGIEPAQSSPERPDHLSLELEFMAFLLMKRREALANADIDPDAAEHADICDQVQRDFFRDHLAWWTPTFAAGLRRKAGYGLHHALAGVLTAWVPDECRRLGIEAVLRPLRPELIEHPEEQSGCVSCPILP
jgi:TorA maturation chaperone TorD